MQLFHNSQDLRYRSPFGAVTTETEVTLRISVAEEEPKSVVLRMFFCDTEHRITMEKAAEENGEFLYQTTILTGDVPGLIWYDFIVEGATQTLYYSNQTDGLGGIGRTDTEIQSNSYQITVYDRTYTVPSWFTDQIMYQIFPDRFCRGAGDRLPKASDYIYHEDWYAPIAFCKHPYEDGPACNDFYGGNLKGIEEKLPYLADLGVGVLYLNPIFEAYSNHRYDTADYKKIDPLLGTEEDFRHLCQAAEGYGISIILDGVFSHTGSDSIYFNKYGSYGENVGAYRDGASPYRAWYQWDDQNGYESWWGCSNLPNVHETEPSYVDYILKDEDSVVKRWIRAGARGWRLDVADELPDEFIRMLRQEVKKANPDAVVLGEVWEDASHKTAYGRMREYLLGHELDSVMNYPFKDGVLAYIMGSQSAEDTDRAMRSQRENYPTPTLYALMNMLGTHDTMRVKSLLGGMDFDCRDQRMPSTMEEIAIKRLQIAFAMQMTWYGVPCIYYGDEIGMEGGKDPYNRGTFLWRRADREIQEWVKTLGNLRKRTGCLRRGRFCTVYAQGGVYVYLRDFDQGLDVFRRAGDGSAVLCMINRDTEERECTLAFPTSLCGASFCELFSGRRMALSKESIKRRLSPLSAEVWVKEI